MANILEAEMVRMFLGELNARNYSENQMIRNELLEKTSFKMRLFVNSWF